MANGWAVGINRQILGSLVAQERQEPIHNGLHHSLGNEVVCVGTSPLYVVVYAPYFVHIRLGSTGAHVPTPVQCYKAQRIDIESILLPVAPVKPFQLVPWIYTGVTSANMRESWRC